MRIVAAPCTPAPAGVNRFVTRAGLRSPLVGAPSRPLHCRVGVAWSAAENDGSRSMTKGRLEAFSDGVIAILITIMVLELPHPHSADFAGLWAMRDKFVSYALSFAFLGIYWNNHHHMLQAVRHVDGRILWANMLLLFWLSLVPFTTAWMGTTGFAPFPVAIYGIVLLLSACSYQALAMLLVRRHGPESPLARALGADRKGKASLALYVLGIAVSYAMPLVAYGLYSVVAVIWLVPDRRIERILTE
jgi:TMEM175 potassium channel family protein